jgi:hypothetical protein
MVKVRFLNRVGLSFSFEDFSLNDSVSLNIDGKENGTLWKKFENKMVMNVEIEEV